MQAGSSPLAPRGISTNGGLKQHTLLIGGFGGHLTGPATQGLAGCVQGAGRGVFLSGALTEASLRASAQAVNWPQGLTDSFWLLAELSSSVVGLGSLFSCWLAESVPLGSSRLPPLPCQVPPHRMAASSLRVGINHRATGCNLSKE